MVVTNGVAQYKNAGVIVSTHAAINLLLSNTVFESRGVVAIEMPAGYAYQQCRIPGLLATARVGGMIEACAIAMLGVPPWIISASEWRKIVVGIGNPTDKQVEHAVWTNLPGMPAKSNVHTRDAMGCALGAYQLNVGGLTIVQTVVKKPAKKTRKRAA